MNKLFKAISMVAVTAVMACGFAACGGESGDVDSEGNTKVTIMFHVDKNSKEGQAYSKRIEAFNKEYKDQKIKATATYKARSTGASNYETELLNNQLEGKLADIITFDAPNCASYAYSSLLYDISELVPANVQNDFISLNKYNNKLYGLPIQESSAGFYYNKKLFTQAGVDVSSYTVDNPWTFDEFKAVCAKLKAANITAVDMRLDATKDETAPYLLYPFVYAAGGSYTSADGFTADGHLNSEKSKAGFQFLKDLTTEGYTSYAIGATDFFTGKVGMYLSSGWTIPDIKNQYKDTFGDDWGLLPYPKGEIQASATGSWCFGITNNHHKDKTAAKELLLWMTSEESAKSITDATGMIPARKSVANAANYTAGSPEDVLLQQLLKSGTARPATVAYPSFSTNFNQIIAGLKDQDLTTLLNTKTSALQAEMDKLKK